MPARRKDAAADRQGRVIDAALDLAAERGWDQVRFHLLAERIGMPMPEIGAAFRDVDAIANAWFARARLHLLGLPETALADLSLDARIATACERWLDFLAPHRDVASEILRGKLWPVHLHHWGPLVFDLSRLVHDLLDTARVPGEGPLRALQEVGLTLMLLATLGDWARDRSEAQAWTKRRLRRRLARSGRTAARLARSRSTGSPQRPAAGARKPAGEDA
jgi:AcrR family transcriptional regulator